MSLIPSVESFIKANIYNSFSKEGEEPKYKSSVAIIYNSKGEILLGKSLSDDDRNDKWCFIGGGIDKGEKASEAAVRETKEEAGIEISIVKNLGTLISSKPSVCFFECKYIKGDINFNHEYSDMKWFKSTPKDLYEPNKSFIKWKK